MRRELFDRILRDLTLVRDKVPPTLLAYPECRIFWLDRAGMNEVKYEEVGRGVRASHCGDARGPSSPNAP